MSIKRPLLQNFKIFERIEIRENFELKDVGRNEMCPCGSGKKFKKCCYSKLHYNHMVLQYQPLDIIKLSWFKVD